MKTRTEVAIRWLIKRGMPEVMSIENSQFEYPWTDKDFATALRQRNCIGMVAEYDHQIVGFMVYELHKSQINLINLAVHCDYERMGIGSQLVERLKSKLSDQRRSRIILEIRERNLPGQLFFKALGFSAIRVLRRHYTEQDEDAYVLRYDLEDETHPFHPRNRITDHINI